MTKQLAFVVVLACAATMVSAQSSSKRAVPDESKRILPVAHITVGAIATTKQYGLRWNLSARDAPMPPLLGVAGRLQRALHNFLETFPLFAIRPSRRLPPAKVEAFLDFCTEVCRRVARSSAS